MKPLLLLAALVMLTGVCGAAETVKMILVEKGVSRAPIVVAKDAPAATAQAADELSAYIEKISGARPPIVVGFPGPMPTNAIWVGFQPKMTDLFPGVKFEFPHPEEILMACNKHHLVIAGRDRMAGTNQTEFGTANAVYTFLEKRLDVRWLWPGELGEDIIKRDTIALAPFEYRFFPPFRERIFRYPKGVAIEQQIAEWWATHQRGRGSLQKEAGGAFGDWWGRYHKEHPDYFALKPDGTRNPVSDPKQVKLCVSNPRVAQQWLDNAEKTLRENPDQTVISVSPNDGGGWCVCTTCRSWDPSNAPPTELYGQPYVMLTDRYVRFWNILARGLKERFPERTIALSTIAYTRYQTPPVAEVLEDNILIGYVGHFPLTAEASRQEQKAALTKWSGKAAMLKYRPNLFYWAGGIWGLPEVAMKKTIEDFRFLAEHRVIALDVDSAHMNYATLGPQLYLMAQLAYDPLQDGNELLADYYRRGFGPAAGPIAAYWNLMEAARAAVVDDPEFKLGARFYSHGLMDILQKVYSHDVLNRAEALVNDAAASLAGQPKHYRERVALLRTGLDYTRLTMQIIPVMARVRTTSGKDTEAVRKAIELCEARDRLFQSAPPFALDGKRILWQINRRPGADYLGPPSEARQAASVNDDPDVE